MGYLVAYGAASHWRRIHGYTTDLSAQVSKSILSLSLSVLVFEAELLCFSELGLLLWATLCGFSRPEKEKQWEIFHFTSIFQLCFHFHDNGSLKRIFWSENNNRSLKLL